MKQINPITGYCLYNDGVDSLQEPHPTDVLLNTLSLSNAITTVSTLFNEELER